MAGLVAPIFRDDQDNPYVGISESSQAEKEQAERKVGSQLGKEDFLLLLVTQMQYQDPLSPQENTDFVAQLAQFSALEQMSNLNQTVSNNSAYALIGQEVLVRITSSTGDVQEVQGSVQKVTLKNGEAYVTIEGQEYSYEDVVQVIDQGYLISTYLPSIMEQNQEYQQHGNQGGQEQRPRRRLLALELPPVLHMVPFRQDHLLLHPLRPRSTLPVAPLPARLATLLHRDYRPAVTAHQGIPPLIISQAHIAVPALRYRTAPVALDIGRISPPVLE